MKRRGALERALRTTAAILHIVTLRKDLALGEASLRSSYGSLHDFGDLALHHRYAFDALVYAYVRCSVASVVGDTSSSYTYAAERLQSLDAAAIMGTRSIAIAHSWRF